MPLGGSSGISVPSQATQVPLGVEAGCAGPLRTATAAATRSGLTLERDNDTLELERDNASASSRAR